MGRKPQRNESLPSCDRLHGYAIVQAIQQRSDDELLIEEGSLYPALQRLEPPSNRTARIYRITAMGRKQLAHETKRYQRLTLAVARVMGGIQQKC